MLTLFNLTLLLFGIGHLVVQSLALFLKYFLRPGRAAGTVTKVSVSKGRRQGSIYRYIYTFEVNGEAFAGAGTYNKAVAIGDPVTVCYSPKRPSDAEVWRRDKVALEIFAYVLPTLGLIVICLSFVFLD